MPNSEYNTIQDLVFSKSFRDWVLLKDTTDAAFWQRWVSEHGEKTELINLAKAVIYTLQYSVKELSEKEVKIQIQKVLQKIKSGQKNDHSSFLQNANENYRTTKLSRIFLQRAAAAVITCIIFVSLYFYSNRPAELPKDIYQSFIEKTDKSGIGQSFIEDTAENIALSDGSAVSLKPNSKLIYNAVFTGNKREVYLTGEAFFKIKRDPSRPFIVYTNSVITKVLGTSFWVKAYSYDKQAVVTVKTGKVSVYKSSLFTDSKNQLVSGIVVTPNQALVYNNEKKEISKTIAEQPLLLTPKPPKDLFAFQATPVSIVFKTMQGAYGISIVFDEYTMEGCSLSATLGDESFYDKLNIICKAINASYEMIDGNIIIASNGCK